MDIAIIGATGVLGRHVVPRLVERGHSVRAVVRKPGEAERLERMGVEAVLGDILAFDTLLPATAGCEAALHLATAVPRPGQVQDYRMNDRIRREGTSNFISACQENGIRRYLQQSITLIYGDQGREVVGEDAAIQPSPVSQSAIDMEGLVRASGFDWCILRGGMLYGTDTGREAAWREAAKAGKLQLPGNGRLLISLIHAVDMARAVVSAIEQAEGGSAAGGRIYNVVDDEPVEYAGLFSYIAAQVNGEVPQPGGEVFLPSLGCSNSRIKEELEWEPVFATYRAGLA